MRTSWTTAAIVLTLIIPATGFAKGGFRATGLWGYTSLNKGPLQGGKQNISYLGGEIGWSLESKKKQVESGIFGDYRSVRKAGATADEGFSSIGLFSRLFFSDKSGPFVDFKIDLISLLFALGDNNPQDMSFFRMMGFGLGLGYRVPVSKMFQITTRVGYQNFRIGFPVQNTTVPARTYAYEASVGLTLALGEK